MGQLNFGNLFRKQQAGSTGNKPMWDIDHRRLREIYNLISKVTSTLKYQNVLEIALDLGSRVLATPNVPADQLVSAVLLFTQSENDHPNLTIGTSRHFPQSDMRIVLPGTSGLIGDVITEGLPKSRQRSLKRPGVKPVHWPKELFRSLLPAITIWVGYLWGAAVCASRCQLFYPFQMRAVGHHFTPIGDRHSKCTSLQ